MHHHSTVSQEYIAFDTIYLALFIFIYVCRCACVCVCVYMCFNSLCLSLPFNLYIYAIFKIIIDILEFMLTILLFFHLFLLLLGSVFLFLPCHGLFLGFCISLFILHFFVSLHNFLSICSGYYSIHMWFITYPHFPIWALP